MGAHAFTDLDEFSRHQSQRALDEALRVRAMTVDAFSCWLEANLTPLQALAAASFAGDEQTVTPSARCFRSPQEKNQYDAEKEVERAVRLALRRLHHAG